MYSLKPILVDQNIELPSRMYKLKPFNSDLAGNMQESKNNSVKLILNLFRHQNIVKCGFFAFQEKSEVELLEDKQNRVLKKLDELKQTLMSMRGDLQTSTTVGSKQSKKSAAVSTIAQKPINVSNLVEVVINVHPSNVPFGILALKSQWQGRLNLATEVFNHSSVKESDFTPASRDFTQKVSAPIAQNNLPTLKLILIWKDVDTTQMLTSPSKFVPIYGEVNIIRFLNRIGPNEFWYESDNQFAALSDATLDICYQLSKIQSVKERQGFVQQLSQRLGKDQFFNSSTSMNISDFAVSSILKKLFAANLKEMPANLSTWLQKLSKVVGY